MSKTIAQLPAGTTPTGEEYVESQVGADSRHHRAGQLSGLFRVRVVSASNVAIATGLEAGDTIDSVTLAVGDAVLLTGQSTTHENGVYVAVAAGAASRHAAFAAYNDLAGMVFSVMEGTTYADTIWFCTSNKGGTIGSTAIAIDSRLRLAPGSAASPSYTFSNDTDVGLYRSASNVLTVSTGGTGRASFSNSAFYPLTSDGYALGSTSNMWSDLFLASGGVINWNNGDVTATHAANTLSFAGASSGYNFDSPTYVTTQFTVTNSGDSAYQTFVRSDAHAATAYLGVFQAYGKDSAGNTEFYAGIDFLSNDNTAGSEDGRIDIRIPVAGSIVQNCSFADGITIGAPTGGFKGTGTLNAVGVYDDNTLLTCMALAKEFLKNGTVDTQKWDDMVPDIIIPAHKERRTVMEEIETDVAIEVRADDGRLIMRKERVTTRVPVKVWEPIWNEEGNGIDARLETLVEEIDVPEQVVPRVHGTARVFKTMIDDGFDPREPEQYFAKMQAEEALPGMPTQADWQHNGLSIGEQFSRKWLAMEMLAIVCNVMWGKLKEHDARLVALEARR